MRNEAVIWVFLFSVLPGSAWAVDGVSGTGMAAVQPVDSASPMRVGETDEKTSLIVTQDYIIGPEDVLDITVWKNAELSKEAQVRPDGRISLPLIGDVAAAGRTTKDLKKEIGARLESYMANPVVSIMVSQVNSYAVYVLGEVGRSGKYPLKTKTTLLQAITLAGGFTQLAARNKIVVFRFNGNGDTPLKIRASYDDIVLREGVEQNIELKPGDTIVVPSETMVMIP